MDAPPVQYVRTSDGYNIAYTVSGEGRPFVFMPSAINHVGLNWGSPNVGPWLSGLSQRFRLVHYDSRGQGMSTRGLPGDFALSDYERDLQTVVEHLQMNRCILLGGVQFGHIAIGYAARHPERVDALVLLTTALSIDAWPQALFLGLARQNWQLFLRTIVIRPHLTAEQREAFIARFRQMTTQAEWCLAAEAFSASDIRAMLPKLRMPVLVLHPRDNTHLDSAEAGKLASQIPDARVIFLDGSDHFGDAAQGIQAIETFLANLVPPDAPDVQRPDGLSAREIEVLRLITAGRSNQQIADELVITLSTVTKHVGSILGKTGAANRTEAAAYAHKHGIA